MLLLLLILVGTELLDISINKTYQFIRSFQFSAYWNLPTFISITLVYIVGQYFILKFVRRSAEDIKTKQKLHFSILHQTVKATQYALIAVLLAVILQMLITSHYNTRLLITSIWISYTLSIIMLCFLARLFFHWFRSNRNIVVLLYTLATASIAIDAGISLTLNTLLLRGQPIESEQLVGGESAFIPNNILPLNYAFYVVSIVSFILTWAATVVLLRHHSRKLGMLKYWIIVSMPLFYFLIQFQPLLVSFLSSYSFAATISFAIVYTIIFGASKSVGGILFAAAFWSMAKKIDSNQLKAYMIMSAFGLALIFGSDQASILTNRPYPPFGLATVSFLGLASYLVLIGVYSSAISVSEDSKL